MCEILIKAVHATNPDPDVFAYAAAQVKNVLEMTHAGMAWRVVSDMNPVEMRQFADLLRNAS